MHAPRPLFVASTLIVGIALVAASLDASRGDTPMPRLRKDTTVAYASVTGDLQAHSSTKMRIPGVMQRVLHGLDTTVFTRVKIGPAPSAHDWQGMWFYADVKVPSATNGQQVPAEWQAELAQGALADLLNTSRQSNTANVIVGSTITGILPNGTSMQVAGGAGDVTSGQVFTAPSDTSAIQIRTTSVLTSFGLDLISIKTWRPLGTAISVVASVPDLRLLSGKLNKLTSAIEGSPAQYDGVYLEIRNRRGVPIVRTATALRIGAGSLWIKPGLGVRFGTMHG